MADVGDRLRITIAYDGSDFHGWQKQCPVNGEPAMRTVAGVLEAALQRVLKQSIDLVGASRTDAKVHAKGQVAHFDAVLPMPLERLAMAVNSRLPPDVEVLAAERVSSDFNAIRSARSKQYRYRIFTSARRPLNHRHSVWHCWIPLDTAAMQQAASRLVGTHDFAGFAAASHGRLTTVRTILECHVEPAAPEMHIVVRGDGFLYNMVRIICGTLVEIGRGRFDPTVIDLVLESGDRRQAGPTLPPQGLCLEGVEYGGRHEGTKARRHGEEA